MSPTRHSRTESNARKVIETLGPLTRGSGRTSAASALTGISYNRLRSLAAGTKEPTQSEKNVLASSARKADLAASVYSDVKDSGISEREAVRRMGILRRAFSHGDRAKALDLLTGVGLSDDRYAAIFGHARGA